MAARRGGGEDGDELMERWKRGLQKEKAHTTEGDRVGEEARGERTGGVRPPGGKQNKGKERASEQANERASPTKFEPARRRPVQTASGQQTGNSPGGRRSRQLDALARGQVERGCLLARRTAIADD